MKATLTFDNGPEPAVTGPVLEVLARHGVKAHFFVLGKHLATPAGRAMTERTIREGHLVGNHSYSHETPLGDDPRPDAVEREIVATQALLDPINPGPRRFRPFGGGGVLGPHLLSRKAADHLQAAAFTCVTWNSVPRDWVDQQGWVKTALDDLQTREHTVVVLHDVANACLEGLDDFLIRASALGARFVLDLPADCLPIVAGRPATSLAALTREEA